MRFIDEEVEFDFVDMPHERKEEKMKEKNNAGGGLGFTSLLQIVFITLKLLGKISWSWVWVLSPTWISTLIVIFIVLLVFMIEGRN